MGRLGFIAVSAKLGETMTEKTISFKKRRFVRLLAEELYNAWRTAEFIENGLLITEWRNLPEEVKGKEWTQRRFSKWYWMMVAENSKMVVGR